MNEAQPRRLDLSLETESPLPHPSSAQFGIDQPFDTKAPLRPAGISSIDGRRFEEPHSWHIGETARQVWDKTMHQASAVACSVSHQVENMGAGITSWIRRNPGTALMCGFGLGFLIADTVMLVRSTKR